MSKKAIMIIMLVLTVFLFSMSCVCASDAAMTGENNTCSGQTIETTDGEILSASNDETVSAETDSQILAADQYTYTDLKNQIGSGGDINLTKGNYSYVQGDGNTIEISTSGVINGNGAVIDMANSTIRAFEVKVSGVTIKNLTIKNANYNGNGGAIYFSQSGTVKNCNFTDNHVTGDYSHGGAIMFLSAGTVTNCKFTGNNATGYSSSGSAVFFSSDGTVTNCNFTNNTAGYLGGAVYFNSKGNVTNCKFTANKATSSSGWGGAIMFASTGTASNCNFTGNEAWHGGAILFYGNGNVTNCNFIRNTASDSDSGALYSKNDLGVTADTCIFKTDSDSTYQVRILPPILNVDNFTTIHNSGEKLTFNLTTNSGMPVDNGNISISVYYKNNDSWVGNYSCLSGEGWTVDLPVGYYYAIFNTEYEGFNAINRTITITPPNNTFWALNHTINANDTCEVNLTNNYYYDSDYDGAFVNGVVINRKVTINGNGYTINAQREVRVFNVQAEDVTIENLTIKNANYNGDGGAVYFAKSGSAINCKFTYNNAYSNGGAMYGGTAINCTFSDNQADAGGAMYGGTAINCTFSDNEADGTSPNQIPGGGGAMCDGTAINCTFLGNKANHGGGAIRMHYGTVENCNFTGNEAYFGGAIDFEDTGTVTNCNFVNNIATGDGGAAICWFGDDGCVSSCVFVNNSANRDKSIICWFGDDGCLSGCVFVNNSANWDDGVICWFGDDGRVSGCVFVNNSASDFIFYFNNYIESNLTINNNIFLNNNGSEIGFYQNDSTSNADYNWFGNNATNYNAQPKTTNIKIDSWLFLNATADPNSISVFDSSDILFKLYSTNGTHISEYDNSKLPVVNLTLTATNGEVSNSTTLDKSIEYRSTKAGQGSVTASVEDAEYTLSLDNIGFNPEFSAKVDPQEIDYGENAAIILKYNATATGTANITLTGKKHTQTIENVDLNKTITLPDTILPDEYEVNVSYSGDDAFANASATSTLTVNQLKSDIKVVGYDIYVNDTTGLIFTVTLPENATGNLTISNGIILNVTKEGRKENSSLIIEIMNDAYPVGQYNWTFTHSGDDIYENSKANAAANILIIPTEITANATSSLFVDDTDKVTYNVTPENAVGDVKFTSNDTSVVEVDQDGNIKAIAEGTTLVTVTFEGCENYTASSANVTVTVSKIATEITLTNETVELKAHENIGDLAILSPAGAGNLTYASSDEDIVLVSDDGIIYARIKGTATITVSFAGDNKYKAAENKIITVTVTLNDARVSVENDTMDLYVDDTCIINATANPSFLTVYYASSNESVATVTEYGNVKAIGEGTAVITLTVGNGETYAINTTNVTVTVSKVPTEIGIENDTLKLEVTDEVSNGATLTPADAGNVTYTISNSSIVKVKDGKIIALAEGEATITVSFAGDVKYVAAENKTINVTISLKPASVSVNNNTLDLMVDDTFNLVATTEPKDLTVNFTSSNPSVVTVDNKGNIAAVSEGTANITVKVGGDGVYTENTATVAVSVSKIPTEITVNTVSLDLFVGDETIINATLTPAGAGNVTFTSSDYDVVDFDDEGNVIAQGKGQAIITVSFAGDNKYAAAENKTLPVTVSLNDANVTVDNDTLDLKVGETYKINATKNPDTILLDITYTSSDESVACVDEKGIVTAVGEGNAIITVEVGDDEIYAKNSTAITVTVNKQDANINVSIPENVTVGDDSNVDVKLPSDATGNVTVKVDGEVIDTVPVTDGTASAKLPKLSAGNHTVEIAYSGDDKYKSASKTATIRGDKDSTLLTADNVTAAYKIKKYLTITLTDSRGSPIANATVSVKLKSLKNYTTDENGQIKVKVSSLVPKTYTAKISFNGDDKYIGSSTTAKVTVKKAASKITAKSKTFKSSTKVKKYTVILKDKKGNPVKKAKVTLKVKGKTYSATTNSKGKATFKLKKLTKTGKFKATIKFKGNDYYKKSSKKVKLTVKSSWKTVSKGSKLKTTVKKIQIALKSNGYYLTENGHYLKVDGIYDVYTEWAVREFQSDNSLKVTGKVDYNTAKKLKLVK